MWKLLEEDAPLSVHWKSAAHTQELLSKETISIGYIQVR